MRNLEKHYSRLWKQSLQQYQNHKFELDPFLDSDEDARYGITLLARPSEDVKKKILQEFKEIKGAAPEQYYYPATDLHVTILSIISCYPGFSLDTITPTEYSTLTHSVVDTIAPFNIHFRGITASPSCIMIQGFPDTNQLNYLRDQLREAFKRSTLQHSIDKRYQLQTAHMTAIRFKKPVKEVDSFLNAIGSLRDRDFGQCKINQLELVGNDWYQQKEKVELIDTFEINRGTHEKLSR